MFCLIQQNSIAKEKLFNSKICCDKNGINYIISEQESHSKINL